MLVMLVEIWAASRTTFPICLEVVSVYSGSCVLLYSSSRSFDMASSGEHIGGWGGGAKALGTWCTFGTLGGGGQGTWHMVHFWHMLEQPSACGTLRKLMEHACTTLKLSTPTCSLSNHAWRCMVSTWKPSRQWGLDKGDSGEGGVR